MSLLTLPDGFPTEIRSEVSPKVEHLPTEPWFFIGDTSIQALWQPWAPAAPLGELWLQPSEQTKSMSEVLACLETWSRHQLSRQAVIVCAGGGVLSDVVGLAASLYQRGLRWHVWPTTLVAQVDASIGGKTGINFGEAKNQVGSFFPPTRVVLCHDFLKTLPSAHLKNGQWEMIKIALLEGDIPWLHSLSEHLGRPETTVAQPSDIERCVLSKVALVHQDPREQGDRKLLNLGHTIGHIVEAASHFEIAHGQAVGFGLIVACQMAAAMGLSHFPSLLLEGWRTQLQSSGHPWPTWEQCAPFLGWDKKKEYGTDEAIFREPLPRYGERALLVSCTRPSFEAAFRKVWAQF
ncbi:MAG: 3-dehydroquinate synthase family protein [Holophagaceae bacterium]